MKIFVTIVMLLTSYQLFAADNDSNVQIIEKPQAEMIYRDSSEFNRMKKDYSLNYIASGVGPNAGYTLGFNLGFFLDRNSLIDFEYTSGRPLNWLTWGVSSYDVSFYSYGLHYKVFSGNSFYFRTGVDYRYVDYLYISRNSLSNAEEIRASFKGSSVNATFLIGNQWQWENFTLGCDWIGITVPLTRQIDSESFSSTNNFYTSEFAQNDQDNYLKKSMTMALRFYLGATF